MNGARMILPVASLTGPLALALPAAAAPTPPSPSTIPTSATTNASYDSDDTAYQVSATVVVPPVLCVGNHSGTTAGQSAAVQLYNAFGSGFAGRETAEVRAYCDGPVAVYATEFEVNDWTAPIPAQVFSPAGVRVGPGDSVRLTATANSGAATLQITNLTTPQSATISGPGFTADDGFLVGIFAPLSNGSGGVITSGVVPYASTPAPIAGPVPSLPFSFLNVQVDGAPLLDFPGLYSLYWTNNGSSSGKTVANVSPIVQQDNFVVGVTP